MSDDLDVIRYALVALRRSGLVTDRHPPLNASWLVQPDPASNKGNGNDRPEVLDLAMCISERNLGSKMSRP